MAIFPLFLDSANRLGNLTWSWRTAMFRNSADDTLDPQLELLVAEVSREVFGPDEDIHQLDSATIEQQSHEVGQRFARRLAQQGAARQAQTADSPQLRPNCRQACTGTLQERPLLIQDRFI